MEFTLYQESLVWRNARNARATTFIRRLAYLMIALALSWSFLTISEHIYLLTYASLSTAFLGVVVLILIRQKKIMGAKVLLIITALLYYLTATIFASGYGINQGTAHFGFITLALVSYFLLSDIKLYREIIPIFFLALFFLFNFGYAPFYPMIILPQKNVDFVHQLDILTTLLIIYFITRSFVIEITKSEEALALSADRLEGLVGSMLPKSIADRLSKEGKTFADEFYACSILIADIAGFTTWSEKHTPNEVVEKLNTVFSRFDDAVERLKLTKIKTSGDSYMVASGVPEFRKDHATVLTTLALELQSIASEYEDFRFRIGINSGEAVAGVIGKRIFMYDIWGDTVNIASRLERSGETEKINVSQATYELIKDDFECMYRGKIYVKHKGEIDMYFVRAQI